MTVWILVLHFPMLNTVVYTKPTGAFTTQLGCEVFIERHAKDVPGTECIALPVKEYP